MKNFKFEFKDKKDLNLAGIELKTIDTKDYNIVYGI